MDKIQAWPMPEGMKRRRGVVRGASRRLLWRILIALSIVGLFHFVDSHVRYREGLRAKYLPTEFRISPPTVSMGEIITRTGKIADGVSSRAEMLANRADWKRLGKGREGEAFAYNNSVIKVYNDRTSPFRDCAPVEGTGLRWPTEIPATLAMEGSMRQGSDNLQSLTPRDAFIPAEDYFRAPVTPGGEYQWHLVTPLLQAGTLAKLAAVTAKDGLSYHEVDRTYRPSLDFMLSALEYLHTEHNLCHDDVKMDNIFVASPEHPTHWVLADLGNARQPNHAYHSSSLWTADTPQLPDCRLNDVVRLVKTYVAFLRAASADWPAFDAAFFRADEPLSRLYWAAVGDAPTAREMRSLSALHAPVAREADADLSGETYGVPGADEAVNPLRVPLAIAVSRHLRIGASERWAKFVGLAPVLGIPVSSCAGDVGLSSDV